MSTINWSELDDAAFVDRAKSQIWLSAFANNNPRAPAHLEADAAYDEAERRRKPWLYKRAWNKAYSLAGHEPSEADLEAAKDPRPVAELSPPGDK